MAKKLVAFFSASGTTAKLAEMNDKIFRPAVANVVENMEQYSTIYIAFPIWWYIRIRNLLLPVRGQI